tara:strand:- start:498 stop:1331 length:834 start_codon:yes stop_codon:yes gene_type:complete
VQRNKYKYPLLKISVFKGPFEGNADSISKEANHAFQLLFVDPTGYTGFPPSALRKFEGRSSEIIVNFMRSFIERFVSGEHEKREAGLIGLVGEKRARFLIDTGITIDSVEAEYLKMLRADLRYKYSAFSPIHHPDRNEIHFHLAYATNHFAGIEVMRSSEFGALSQHDRNRFKKKQLETGGDLFSNMFEDMEISGPYFKARKRHLDQAADVLGRIISQQPKHLAFGDVAALAQQELYLKQSELSDVIVEMAQSGLVHPTWLDRRGRKPNASDMIIPK